MSEESKFTTPFYPISYISTAPFDWRGDFNTWNVETIFEGVNDKRNINKKKPLYKIAQLTSLTTAIAEAKEEENKNRARFVLPTLDAESLTFAPEGDATETIPGHIEMVPEGSNTVVSAGTVYFDEAGKINAIDHKTGAFKTSFASLRPVLVILQTKGLLAEKVTLKKLYYNGDPRDKTTIAASDLEALATPAPLIAKAETNNADSSPPRQKRARNLAPPVAALRVNKKHRSRSNTSLHTYHPEAVNSDDKENNPPLITRRGTLLHDENNSSHTTAQFVRATDMQPTDNIENRKIIVKTDLLRRFDFFSAERFRRLADSINDEPAVSQIPTASIISS